MQGSSNIIQPQVLQIVSINVLLDMQSEIVFRQVVMYLAGAALYAVGMGLMCFFVREGEYPPLTEEQLRLKNASLKERILGKIRGFKDFVKESFCHRVYTYRYMMGVIGAIGGAAWGFGYFLNGELGIDDALLGKISGVQGIIGTVGIMLASVLTAELANRWHPARIVLYNAVFAAIVALPFNLRWLFGTYPPQVYAVFCIVSSAINVALSGLLIISEQPFEMLFFPKSKYGAFCEQGNESDTIVIVPGVNATDFEVTISDTQVIYPVITNIKALNPIVNISAVGVVKTVLNPSKNPGLLLSSRTCAAGEGISL